jgi:hypothetical protein
MRVPITREAQNAADLIAENRQRFVARKRQTARSAGGGTQIKAGTTTRASAARRAVADSSPRKGSAHPFRAMRAAGSLPSGPAVNYAGFALSLIFLVIASLAIGAGLVIFLVHRGISRVAGSD